MPRKSFSIHSDYYDELRGLNAEQRGDLLLAFIKWANDEDAQELDPMCAILFRLMKAQVERISSVNSANGSKGGRGNKSEDTEKSEESGEKPKKASVPDTVPLSDTDSSDTPPLSPEGEKQPDKYAQRKAEIKAIWQSYSFSEPLGNVIKSWGEYKREKRQEYKPRGLKSLLTEVQNNAAKYGEDAVIAVINKSMAANWQGIAWDKLAHLPDARGAPKSTSPAAHKKTFSEIIAERHGTG